MVVTVYGYDKTPISNLSNTKNQPRIVTDDLNEYQILMKNFH